MPYLLNDRLAKSIDANGIFRSSVFPSRPSPQFNQSNQGQIALRA